MTGRFHPSPRGGIFKTILGAAILSVVLLSQEKTIALFADQFSSHWFPTAIMAIWAFALVLIVLSFIRPFFRTIEMNDNNIRVISGILNVHSVVIPYDRITDVQSTQAILQRLVGVGSININTAGENTGIIMLEDLTRDHMEAIERILEERRHPKVIQ